MTTGQIIVILLRVFVPLLILRRPLAGGIIAMLLDDYYQQTLHAPPPQPGDLPDEPYQEEAPRDTGSRKERSRRHRRR